MREIIINARVPFKQNYIFHYPCRSQIVCCSVIIISIHKHFQDIWQGACTDQNVMQKCIAELVGKITNCCKKNWDMARKRRLQHLQGHATTLNLRDILKAQIAK